MLGTKLLRLLNKGSSPFILQDEILDRRWIRGLVLAQIQAQSMISQQEPQLDWRQTRQTYTPAYSASDFDSHVRLRCRARRRNPQTVRKEFLPRAD